ncbi:MAG: FtsX-like permease family protein, partial [Flavobacteriales bacterium]
LSFKEIESCVEQLRSKDIYIAQFTHFKSSSDWCEELNEYYHFAFNFKDLDEIRNFKNHMKEEYAVEIDMSQIEAKENFNLVTKLTTLISLILLIFAVLSIMLFVQNLLSSHLFKIRSKLGTFKAFGMSNNELNIVYLKIIFSFLALGIVIAFMSVAACDLLEATISEESKFNIFDMKTLLTIVVILLISLLMSYKTIKKILGDTPGNLIYER